jgi:hypothetical protein
MVEVYVIYTGHGQTNIPGGPFADRAAAYDALEDFAVLHHGTWRAMRLLLDGYGFVVHGVPGVYVQLRP